ncbi:PfkB family carbohydrate kinase [Escherichia coli]
MIELSEKGADVKRGFGGDTRNTSVDIARQVDPGGINRSLRNGAGNQQFSQQMLDAWHGENVDTSLTQRMENRFRAFTALKPTAPANVRSTTGGTKPPPNSAESEQSAAICEELANFDYLYLSGISLAILSPTSREKLLSLLRECRAKGGKSDFRQTLSSAPVGQQRRDTAGVPANAGMHGYRLPDAGRRRRAVGSTAGGRRHCAHP